MEIPEQENRTTGLPKLKILQSAQRNFATVGISSKAHPLNTKLLIGFLILVSYLICNLVFAYVKAKKFTEYTHSSYILSVVFLTIFVLITIILNVEKLFQVINDCESLTNTSECDSDSPIYFSVLLIF